MVQNGDVGGKALEMSKRIRATDDPIMVQSSRIVGGVKNPHNLGQGAVYWGPCHEAVEEACKEAETFEVFSYNFDHGLPALREALRKKISKKNGLDGYEVSVTAGANQGLSLMIITLVDPSDKVVMFKPYYFNALMAVQMMGGAERMTFGPSDPSTMHPDLDWLEEQCNSSDPPKLVYMVNPSNPTGIMLDKSELERIADITAKSGTWVMFDNTYEEFDLEGKPHYALNRPNFIHLFSFSKSKGLMGWRVGYVAYPGFRLCEFIVADHDGKDRIGSQFIKALDTIPIHGTVLAQKVALGSLKYADQYTKEKIETLQQNRQALIKALEPCGTYGNGFWGGNAIYFFAKLPGGVKDDLEAVKWMAQKHKVVVIPGSGCGFPGHVRVAYGRPDAAEKFQAAADALNGALKELAEKGPSVLENIEV